MLRIATLLLLMLMPTLALAADGGITDTGTVAPVIDPNAPVDVGFVVDLIAALTKAFADHSWTLVAGLFLTIIVAGLRFFEFVKKIPNAWVPWAVMGISILASVAVGLQQGLPWGSIVTGGITVGVVAIGGWETLGKMLVNFLKKLFAKKEPEPTPEPEPQPEKSEAPPADPPG